MDWSNYNTLLLDRDGVINRHRPDDYVKRWSEFEFLPAVPQAIALMSRRFEHIFVVTNQRGVGKGLMSEETLKDIHTKMVAEIEKAGGRIDGIYYCTATDNSHPDRKPNPGMARRIADDNSAVDLSRAVMVGDRQWDEEFAANAGVAFIKAGRNALSLPEIASMLCGDYSTM